MKKYALLPLTLAAMLLLGAATMSLTACVPSDPGWDDPYYDRDDDYRYRRDHRRYDRDYERDRYDRRHDRDRRPRRHDND